MSSFTRVVVEPTSRTVDWWRLQVMNVQPFDFEVGFPGSGWKITVPAGQVSDGVSAPWWILPFIDAGAMYRSALLHDYLQTRADIDPWRADLIFLEALSAEGVCEPQRTLAWLAVRWRTRRRLAARAVVSRAAHNSTPAP